MNITNASQKTLVHLAPLHLQSPLLRVPRTYRPQSPRDHRTRVCQAKSDNSPFTAHPSNQFGADAGKVTEAFGDFSPQACLDVDHWYNAKICGIVGVNCHASHCALR
jgi:hypothetical protein